MSRECACVTCTGAPCFDSIRQEEEAAGRKFGHGPCIDPHGVGCTCEGTAVDGECEACWLYLK